MASITQSFPVHLWWLCWFTREKVALSFTCVFQFSSHSLMTSLCSSAAFQKIKWTLDALRNTYCFSVSFLYWPIIDRGQKQRAWHTETAEADWITLQFTTLSMFSCQTIFGVCQGLDTWGTDTLRHVSVFFFLLRLCSLWLHDSFTVYIFSFHKQ